MKKILIGVALLALPMAVQATYIHDDIRVAPKNRAKTEYSQGYNHPGKLHGPRPNRPHYKQPHRNVPEPSSLALLGIGALGLLRAWRTA